MDNDTQPAQIAPVQAAPAQAAPAGAAHPAERLEAALARIARQANAPDPVATEVAARLDGLIAQLRSALEQ